MIDRVSAQLGNSHKGRLSQWRDVGQVILEDLLRSSRNLLYLEELPETRDRQDRIVFDGAVGLWIDAHGLEHGPRPRIDGRDDLDGATPCLVPVREDAEAHGEHGVYG